MIVKFIGRNALRFFLYLSVLFAFSGNALADLKSQSFSSWQISKKGMVTVQFKVAQKEIIQLQKVNYKNIYIPDFLREYLISAVTVGTEEHICPIRNEARTLNSYETYMIVEMSFLCGPTDGLIFTRLFRKICG